MARDEPDDLDKMIAKRAETNPDFPAMVKAARERRRAKLKAANDGAPDLTDEKFVDDLQAHRQRGSDARPPS